MNILTEKLQLDVLRMLTEGGSINGTARYTGVARETCTRLMLRFGEACNRFLDREMRDLDFVHLQLDELWTFCGKKKKNVTGNEPNLHEIGEFYLFWALHEQTRLIPAFQIGRRDEGTAMEFLMSLQKRMKMPKPHLSDDHDFQPGSFASIVRISTDAFGPYVNAIDCAFGPYADYAQIVKKATKKKLSITKKLIRGDVDESKVSTSLVERANLTARTFIRRLMRRSLSFSKKVTNMRAATAIYVAHYNYCWRVKTIGTTPAVAQGLIGHEWKLHDLYRCLRDSWPMLFYLEIKDDGKEVA